MHIESVLTLSDITRSNVHPALEALDRGHKLQQQTLRLPRSSTDAELSKKG